MNVRSPLARLWLLALAACLLGGCYEKRIQWSPDGHRAVVVTSQGTYLSDAEGHLSKQVLPQEGSENGQFFPVVDAVAWFGDSERLAVAISSPGLGGRMVIGKVVDDRLIIGKPLYRGSSIMEIRVAPGDDHLAITVPDSSGSELGFELLVVAVDGRSPPVSVARHTSAYPDWSPDGHALFYFEAAQSAGDDLRLGTLVHRAIVDDQGDVDLAPEPVYLAGVLHGPLARVRSLQDGRVLFSAVDVRLPLTAGELGGQREQLCLLEPSREGGLIRLVPDERREVLPRQLAFFEVSPDESEVLVGTLEGDVGCIDLETGEVVAVQAALAGAVEMQAAPVWRLPGEFTYIRRSTGDRVAEVVLRKAGSEVVLSEGWGPEVVTGLVR